ncbi:hypothetical protein PpBr36_05467 [Pyricularia pennisetigena]|uniref:hypothetical protein n=1 Tax=Pyricularia pennisetigena TaxID=1578925 RepID=UPI0011540425|nr:hypothetical protein PpBr36_05467 [Pyricularia pennisetigena]TLS27445.1 hypothetical protein PpBr36_05467 [Pyricularia pennisetigena]
MLLIKVLVLGFAAVASAHCSSPDGGTSCGSHVSAASSAAKSAVTKMLSKRDQSAMELYKEMFPNGASRISTSGEGLLCGLRALLSSLEAQMPDLKPFPDVEQMHAFANYGNTAETYNQWRADTRDPEDTLEEVKSNYPADFLAGVLSDWAMACHGFGLQLGVRRREFGTSPDGYLVIRTGNTPIGTLWVAHSSDHYEGLKPNPGPNRPWLTGNKIV